MALLLAYLPDPVARDRLGSALLRGTGAGAHRMQECAGWAELHAAAGAATGVAMVLFDPFAGPEGAAGACERFHHAYPSTVLVAYGDFHRATARQILELGRAGVTEIAERGVHDSPTALSHLIVSTLSRSRIVALLDLLERRLPREAGGVLRALAAHLDQPITPAQVARLFHCHPKTLRERLRRAGLPSTERLIVWMRLLHAAHLLGDPHRTVEQVALRLGFPSANSLRNQLRRYGSVGPGELARADGPDLLLRRFEERCRPAGLVPTA